MTLSELFQTLKTLSKADLNSVKQFLESIDYNYNGFEDFLLSKKAENGISCPHCSSFNIKKNGHKGLMQRFMCHDCHKTFSARNNTITFSSKKSFATWKKYLECMMNGFTVRRSAEICGINKDTAFIWRHKVLDALQNMQNSVELNGVVEADETFFALSFKGNHKKSTSFVMPREAHKRGNDVHTRGLSHEQVCVPCAVTQDGLSISKQSNLGRASTKNLSEVFSGRIASNSVLCADAHHSYQKFAKENKLELIQLKTGKSKKGIFHVQHINSYHSILKTWIIRFHGVATKYLDNYLVWHNFVNWAKDPYEKKSEILSAFVFCTNKTVKSKELSVRSPLPCVA
ncbi:IS1595 family transposase [Treponema saccharophilum]|uniref:Insertion element protein n=1 Tax=Treponema saccharophilum DSM 2985 TaxID=907348 RepID=H7EPS1_9SPIR|nr:IS1595 family transposase [Treponema saccharophilum]EIC00472.1 Insertion element protein [Treponema saccharophilum DSM 2985]BDC95008.1 transposase [Treponema saccharophilum]